MGSIPSASTILEYLSGLRAQARMLLQESGREPKCAICGFSEYVEACHIKAISSFPLDTKVREVNSLDNLVYLCPNHHILFDRGT